MALMSPMRPEDQVALMQAPASPDFAAVQHPMHAIVAPIGPPPPELTPDVAQGMSPDQPNIPSAVEGKQPKVTTMSPIQRYEERLAQKQMSDFDKDANPYGSENNHPGFFGKFLHGLSVATGGPNRRLAAEGERNAQIQGIEKQQTEQNLQEAQTRNQDLQPQLKQAQLALSHEKQDEVENHHNEQINQQLHQHGFKQDESGNIVPLAYEEMSPQQQAVTDLKNSQQNLADATEEVRRASIDPNSPAYQLALKKLQVAQQGHQAAQTRAQAALMNAYGGNYGTDTQGNALPGAMLTPEGQPVGSHFASNVRPTGQERNKADMAASADNQINDMLSIVQKRPDIFGPAAGRKTDFTVWIGSQDPDAQRFRAARTIAGDHLAGTFGGRSEAALNALDSAIGHFRDNPAAVTAGLNQLKSANNLFLQRGTVHTVGGNNSEAGAPKPGEVVDGYRFKGGNPAEQKNWEQVKK
jgi:hypothetical protein